jgi:alkyl hydroperoxide reductase subunit AhpC
LGQALADRGTFVIDPDGDYEFTTYLSLTCQNCPEVVQALNLMSGSGSTRPLPDALARNQVMCATLQI